MDKRNLALAGILIGLLASINAAWAQIGLPAGIGEVTTYSYAVVFLVVILFAAYMFIRGFMMEFMGESKFVKAWDKLIIGLLIFVGIIAALMIFGIEIPAEVQPLMGVPTVLILSLIGITVIAEGSMRAFSGFLTKHKGAMVVEELRSEAYRAAKLGDTARAETLRKLATDYEKEERYLKGAEKEARKLGEPEEVTKIVELEKRVGEQVEVEATVGQMTEVEKEAGKGKPTIEAAKAALAQEGVELGKETEMEEVDVEKKMLLEDQELQAKLKTITDPRLRKQSEKAYLEKKKEAKNLLRALGVEKELERLEKEEPAMAKQELKEESAADALYEAQKEQIEKESVAKLDKKAKKYVEETGYQ